MALTRQGSDYYDYAVGFQDHCTEVLNAAVGKVQLTPSEREERRMRRRAAVVSSDEDDASGGIPSPPAATKRSGTSRRTMVDEDANLRTKPKRSNAGVKRRQRGDDSDLDDF